MATDNRTIGGRPFAEVLAEAEQMGRYCYVAKAKEHDENGYIPCLVEEGKPGYRVMSGNGEHASPWYWGETFDACQAMCDKFNHDRLNLSVNDVLAIRESARAAFVKLTAISYGLQRHQMVEQYIAAPTPENWFAIRDFMLEERTITVLVNVYGGNVTQVRADTPHVTVILEDEDNIAAGDERPEVPETVAHVVF